ncbi:hypothetical protein UA08_02527 [Talaromyces atroroseus]|uniref:Uncharacterized protein n=1 Tax=Talaromyces atroroseus TaxID=1441469 RepID=A0A225AR95_TALAT|nr:hypothetical protein UA08_02527 [Talaromyces atroroseus]OKL62023.1 hypothetical protein UA08_02527 [Talaromyces atroroseus]
MRHFSTCGVFKAALACLYTTLVLPATAYSCAFSDNTCIDSIAQVSISFQFESISPSPLLFFYAFDGGFSYANGSSVIKVGYWLQYDQSQLTAYNELSNGTNWTTEAALRIGNLGGYVGGSNNGCDGVWGNACSESLKFFLQTSMFNLARSGIPYDMPLQTVLQPLTDGIPGPYIQGCPSTLFQLNDIPTYAVINKTTFGYTDQSTNVSVAPSGSASSSWRTWTIPDITPMQQAREVAVGIITRGPVYGSEPLTSPDDIQIELVCSRAPKQGHFPDPGPGGPPDDKSGQGFARGIIKTYAFDDDYDYEDEVEDDNESDDSFEANGYVKCAEVGT